MEEGKEGGCREHSILYESAHKSHRYFLRASQATSCHVGPTGWHGARARIGGPGAHLGEHGSCPANSEDSPRLSSLLQFLSDTLSFQIFTSPPLTTRFEMVPLHPVSCFLFSP